MRERETWRPRLDLRALRGSKPRIGFTIAVFVVLASLDNAVIGILPPMYGIAAGALNTSETSLGLVTAVSILVIASTAAPWGYGSDILNRKRLVQMGTLLWVAGILLSVFSRSFVPFFASQVVTAIGLGCLASVGTNLVAEFISPGRRGLAMGLFGVGQGIGLGAGTLLGGALGPVDWRLPYLVLAAIGIAFAALAIFAVEPIRGRSDGAEISPAPSGLTPGQAFAILTKGANGWIVLQGFAAQITFGSLIWLPRVLAAKAGSAGFSSETATLIGSVLAILVQLGGIFSLVGGYLGDAWQRRDLRARALIAGFGLLTAVPLGIGYLLMPLSGTPGATGVASLIANPWLWGMLIFATGSVALSSINGPNWLALVSDVNLPEHRGTVLGVVNMVNGFGRALGAGSTGLVVGALGPHLAAPWDFAVPVALFQLFLIPAGLCFLQAARHSPADITAARQTIAKRSGN